MHAFCSLALLGEVAQPGAKLLLLLLLLLLLPPFASHQPTCEPLQVSFLALLPSRRTRMRRRRWWWWTP